MLKIETEADLEALHSGNVKESLHLEYKASPAVDKKDDSKKIEMARDVSAFANSDGGQIVYGMTEKDHGPAGLDAGLDPKVYPQLWFEQILQQHITPHISGLTIHHVSLANGNVAIVIEVPPSSGDPHQVSDNKYYRRHNFNRLPMEHYEIRDRFRRTTVPDLNVSFSFDRMRKTHDLRFERHGDDALPAGLTPFVSNESNEPALYAVVFIGIDARLKVQQTHYETLGQSNVPWEGASFAVHGFRLRFHPNSVMPIFKEMPTQLPNFGIIVPENMLLHPYAFFIRYEVRAPGCQKDGVARLYVERGKQLSIKDD